MALGVILTIQNNRPVLRERRCEPSKARSDIVLSVKIGHGCWSALSAYSSRLVIFNHYSFDVNVCDSYFRRCSSSVNMVSSLTIRVTEDVRGYRQYFTF